MVKLGPTVSKKQRTGIINKKSFSYFARKIYLRCLTLLKFSKCDTLSFDGKSVIYLESSCFIYQSLSYFEVKISISQLRATFFRGAYGSLSGGAPTSICHFFCLPVCCSSIHHAQYLRNHTSSDHNFWYTYVK